MLFGYISIAVNCCCPLMASKIQSETSYSEINRNEEYNAVVVVISARRTYGS